MSLFDYLREKREIREKQNEQSVVVTATRSLMPRGTSRRTMFDIIKDRDEQQEQKEKGKMR